MVPGEIANKTVDTVRTDSAMHEKVEVGLKDDLNAPTGGTIVESSI